MVQVIPSVDVIIMLELAKATATNTPFPKATETHELALAAVRGVQVTPSGDVITRFVPSLLTATKTPFP